MNPIAQTIAKIQYAYADEADPLVFKDLLEQEKKGKKRKVLKRWLRERIKFLEPPQAYLSQSPILPSRTPKDKITGIPVIG